MSEPATWKEAKNERNRNRRGKREERERKRKRNGDLGEEDPKRTTIRMGESSYQATANQVPAPEISAHQPGCPSQCVRWSNGSVTMSRASNKHRQEGQGWFPGRASWQVSGPVLGQLGPPAWMSWLRFRTVPPSGAAAGGSMAAASSEFLIRSPREGRRQSAGLQNGLETASWVSMNDAIARPFDLSCSGVGGGLAVACPRRYGCAGWRGTAFRATVRAKAMCRTTVIRATGSDRPRYLERTG